MTESYFKQETGEIPVSAADALKGDKAPKAPAPVSSDKPKVGDMKIFPNGRKAKWDGKGWVAI